MRAAYLFTFLAVLGYVQAIALSKLQRRANNRNKKHRRDPSWPSVGGDVGKGCLTVFVQQPASLPFQAVQPAPHPTRTVTVDVTTNTTTTLPSGVGGVSPGSGGPAQSLANTVSGTQASPVSATGEQGGGQVSATSSVTGPGVVPSTSKNTKPGSVSDKTGLTINAGSSKPIVLTTTSGAASATSANSTTKASQQTGAASAGNHKAKGLTAADVVAAASVAGKVGWAKSWASARGGVPMSIPFIPML